MPATVLQWVGALESGRGARENRNQPGGFNIRIYHGITPKTESSCYYFWTPLNGYKPKEKEATQLLYKEIAFTFNEDIESRQSCMAATLDQVFFNTKDDSARLLARRSIERMIQKETKAQLAPELRNIEVLL